MSISPLTFTGASSHSSDLQQILSRAVSIAQLPLKSLQNEDSDVLQKTTLLSAMATPVGALGDAVAALGTLASNKAIGATSSDSTIVSVVNNGASNPAVYTISEITSLAKSAAETSINSYPDTTSTSVSANGSMELVVGAKKYDFTLTNNNLAGLVDQINSLGSGMTASVITSGDKNYLSITANDSGSTTLKLIDDPSGAKTDLLTNTNQGSDAVFKVNGVSVSRSSNIVDDVASGVTFTLLNKTTSGQTVDLTLASDRSRLSTAIQTFVSSYNAVVDQVNAQVGPGAGLLSGDYLVRELQTGLRSLGGYQASGTIKSLADMGIEFDSSGKISFKSSTFNSLSNSQISGAFQFFGSTTTGFGALADKFTQLSDPIDGLFKLQENSYTESDKRLQTKITNMTDSINAMQKSLSARLQTADALLAQLESQQSVLTSSVASLNYVLYGKPTNSN